MCCHLDLPSFLGAGRDPYSNLVSVTRSLGHHAIIFCHPSLNYSGFGGSCVKQFSLNWEVFQIPRGSFQIQNLKLLGK